MLRLLLGVLVVGLPLSGCAAQTATVSVRFDLSRRLARHDLPGRLDEISGLAFSPDGRLFAHGDERGHVFEIDPVTGEVGKRMEVGDRTVEDDFEGIAIVGERFFLVSSRGLLYEFREVDDGGESPYRVTDALDGVPRCEVEGLDYDTGRDELLVACKSTPGGSEGITVHRVPLASEVPRPDPVRVAAADLSALGFDEVHPSGVALDPATGTLLLVAAREELLLEIDHDGRVLEVVRLSRERHAQPEGIAIGPDGTLYIADEENDKDARLTAYAPRRPPPGS